MKTKTMIAAAALALMMASGAAYAQTAAQDEAARRADEVLQQRIDNANADRLANGLPLLTLEGVKQAGRDKAAAAAAQAKALQDMMAVEQESIKRTGCGTDRHPISVPHGAGSGTVHPGPDGRPIECAPGVCVNCSLDAPPPNTGVVPNPKPCVGGQGYICPR